MATQTWWRAYWERRIEPVQVERFTEQSVWIDGRRRARMSDGYGRIDGYFPTWAEARDALLEEAEGKVASIRLQLEQANGKLGNIRGMKEPTP